MSILEIDQKDLALLGNDESEELVSRLCEAEMQAKGYSARYTRLSGEAYASDGGIDVSVSIPDESFIGEYIPRPRTIFQAKNTSMTPSKIKEEIKKHPDLFKSLKVTGGAYVIACLQKCYADKPLKDRLEAMKEAIQANTISIDFYDQSRLHQWLRQYPAVGLWVRKITNKPLTGWRGFDQWTTVPSEADDKIILEDGVRVFLPDSKETPLSIADAIPKLREYVFNSNKALRIIGLSGVGKTRLVQALFEKINDGDTPLEPHRAVYTDTSLEPNPSISSMLENLNILRQKTFLVVDNCSAETHRQLTSTPRKAEVKLITVEYDIRDDEPETTDIVRIEVNGTEITKRLILQRYPQTFHSETIERIANFAEGNARLALLIAEAAPKKGKLTELTNQVLFERLFYQRHDKNDTFKRQAEVLALVHSFSVGATEYASDELEPLAKLCECSPDLLHRTCAELMTRQIIQRRGQWRAVLPHPIANRLAKDALKSVPRQSLKSLFEHPNNRRLLKSFAKRLSHLYDDENARRIVQS